MVVKGLSHESTVSLQSYFGERRVVPKDEMAEQISLLSFMETGREEQHETMVSNSAICL